MHVRVFVAATDSMGRNWKDSESYEWIIPNQWRHQVFTKRVSLACSTGSTRHSHKLWVVKAPSRGDGMWDSIRRRVILWMSAINVLEWRNQIKKDSGCGKTIYLSRLGHRSVIKWMSRILRLSSSRLDSHHSTHTLATTPRLWSSHLDSSHHT